MRRIPAVLFIFLLAGLVRGQQALASLDYMCTQTWKLVHRSYEGCSNQAMLVPANDTRVNLLLLMADLHAARYKKTFAAPPAAQSPDSPLFGWQMIPGWSDSQRSTTQESPLFSWEEIAARFAPPGTQPAPSDDEAQAEHDKCPTTFDPADGFPGAVRADASLVPEEREALLAARLALRCKESQEALTKAAKAATTPAGRAFLAYLAAADRFWQGAYPEAAAAFAPLAKADVPWLKETAQYMLGRTALKVAQEGAFDTYGEFNRDWKPDERRIADAQATLDTYLQTYPQGLYAQSARGLKRRCPWLAGAKDALAKEYGALMVVDHSDRKASDPELAQEIDNKLLMAIYDPQANGPAPKWDVLSQTPALLAVLDLQRMRKPGSDQDAVGSTITRAELEAQRQLFAGNMPLYEYLLAAYAFFVEDKPAEALRLIPDAGRQDFLSYFEFSRQMLRGLALEAMKDRNALGFWTQMLPGATMPFQRAALELAIALHHERAGMTSRVFEADSPVRYPYLRQTLLLYSADAALLRKQAQDNNAPQRERDKALFILLYKEATRGHAADFLKDLALAPADAPVKGGMSPDGSADAIWYESAKEEVPLGIFRQPIAGEYGCPSLVEVQTLLTKEPRDPKALLCVSDFVRRNSEVSAVVDHPPPADELGGSPSRFAGKPHVRMETYQAVLTDPKASADNKAYALYRSIRCYAPGGNNGCGGADVALDQRKAWFLRLKKEYPASRWAKELKYYW